MATLTNDMYRKIDQHLESIYENSVALAGRIVQAGLDTKSQIRGFETLVNSTSRFSEIKNFIKNQAGKEGKQSGAWRQIAGEMLAHLDSLEAEAANIVGNNLEQSMEAKLRLARGWSKQVLCHYLYARPQER